MEWLLQPIIKDHLRMEMARCGVWVSNPVVWLRDESYTWLALCYKASFFQSSEVQTLTKEVEKQKELLSSSDVRIKWAQNKLKAELDAHKVPADL